MSFVPGNFFRFVTGGVMGKLEDVEQLVVNQDVEMAETFLDYEQANKYEIRDGEGQTLFFAMEEGGNFVSRNFLESRRPFSIHILTSEEETFLRLERPFAFFFDELEVRDGDGRVIGKVQWAFKMLGKKLSVANERGTQLMTLKGPLFSPWTFEVETQNQNVGKITKEWSGMGKELFTDEEQFGVKFTSSRLEEKERKLLLGAVFLIDFLYFESSE